jgi:predicted component of type VI protein secretion system
VTTDLIEGYLDRLLAHLRGSAQDVRRILSEAEEHLRDATAELVAAGGSEADAQRPAIARSATPAPWRSCWAGCSAPRSWRATCPG